MSANAKLLLFLLAAAALLLLLQEAGSALTPFALGAVVAYILSPLADKMEARNINPSLAAAMLVLLVLVALIALPLALIPLVAAQIKALLAVLPDLAARAGDWLGQARPYVEEQLRALDFSTLAGSIETSDAASAAGAFVGFFGKGVAAVAGFFALLVITPLTAFYFLRDRKIIAGELTNSLPPRMRDEILLLLRDLDNVLDEFLHGQLSVMAVMAVVYSVVLYVAGLDFALLIGLLSGILVFIPYAGFIIGLTLATLAAFSQFESWGNIILLWALMGGGTIFESFFITPWLVGERIGLHPVVVLLAVMVMGSVLGFVGVLLALPLSAVLLVLLRYLRRRYVSSNFYGGT